MKTLKRIAWSVAAVFLLLVVAAAVRMHEDGALFIEPVEGRRIGYSARTGEWLWLAYPAVPPARDGPYVMREGDRRVAWVLEPDAAGVVHARKIGVGDRVDVVVDDAAATRFSVPLRERHPRDPVRWPMPERILAVSDIEGEFAAFVRLLRANGVIDERFAWTWGAGHLVLVGDMVDRGSNVVPVLWLVYKLEAEARAAGGAVHYVLGNHEQYLLQGRPKHVADKYYATINATGLDHGELWSAGTELGRWLRSKPVLVKVGDTLFAHGGISPRVLATGLDIDAIDAVAARRIDLRRRETESPLATTLLQAPTALTKYRGLARASRGYQPATPAHVRNLLAHFGVRRITIGHTLVERVGLGHDGRVLRLDVHHAGGVSEGVLLEDGRLWRVDDAGARFALGRAVDVAPE
ncbi:MAG TPA: metallophosphoesterase [Luteimonas sp.]